jgi:hypothetical protein
MTSFHLVTRKCKVCDLKLTEFEYQEKSSLCMECYNEKYADSNKPANKPHVLRRTRNKRFINGYA